MTATTSRAARRALPFVPVTRRAAALLALAIAALVSVPPVARAGDAASAPPADARRAAPGPVRIALTSASDGKPLAGLRVRLGGREAATGEDGAAVLDGVPAGAFALAVEADGFERLERAVTLPAGRREAIAVALVPAPLVDLEAQVVEEGSGRPVAGARVALAPLLVRAAIQGPALAVTDWGGRTAFAALPTGRYRVEASGFQCAPRTLEAELAPGGAPLRIEFTPLPRRAPPRLPAIDPFEGDAAEPPIEEREPNGDAQGAQDVRFGAAIALRISTPGDVDAFRFRLPRPALVRIAVAAGGPLETHVRVLDAAGRFLTERGAHRGHANEIDLALGGGTYHVTVQEWGQNDASEAPVTLRVTRTEAPDVYEPNDARSQARALATGDEVTGCIFPVGDIDRFRFEMRRPGFVRVTMPEGTPLERHARIETAEGAFVSERGVHAGQALELVAQLAPGAYELSVREWGENNCSTVPYGLRLEAMEDDGIDDTLAAPSQGAPGPAGARLLEPGAVASTTIFPVGDVDRWRLAIPSAGRLVVRGTAPFELHVRLTSADGAFLAEQGVHAGQRLGFERHFEGPASVILDAREWGENGCSHAPATIWTELQPCDEQERLGRNEGMAAATPAVIGEPLRGTILPLRDVDAYRVEVDHPGTLRVAGVSPTELHVRLLDAKGALVGERGSHAGARNEQALPVLPGTYGVDVREWGENGWSLSPYALETRLLRAEPEETVPLRDDPPRALTLGEGRSFAFDQRGDRDRFMAEAPSAGAYVLRITCALEVHARVFDDRTGAMISETGRHAWQDPPIPVKLEGPTRLRVELFEWGQNAESLEPGAVLLDDERGRRPPLGALETEADPCDPTLVTVRLAAAPPHESAARAVRAVVDLDGDGRTDCEVAAGGEAKARVPSEGLFQGTARLVGEAGVDTVRRIWVEAVGPRERVGVALIVDAPAEGALLSRDEPARARAWSWSGAPIAAVSVSVDGRTLGTDGSAPFSLDVPWRALGPGEHVVALEALDARGTSARVERRVRVSPYFDLRPEDGAVVTGDEVRVGWEAPAFGPARARVRERLETGEAPWREVTAESGRARRVALPGLEPGRPYEWQPLGDGEPGPVRVVTRVPGLAFGRPRYGATVARDYDQRVAVSVRNHGETPLVVRLACGRPADARLLAGFAGEGSEGAPVPLGPGEERSFLLGISAQDVVTERHRFPVRITSDAGLHDEAEVDLRVRLPVVKLAWEDLGATEDGVGRRLRLTNLGDPLTDLALTTGSPELLLSPEVSHGLLPAGRSLDVVAAPRLHEGFRALASAVSATAVATTVGVEVRCALPPGKRIFGVMLTPGMARAEGAVADGAAGATGAADVRPGEEVAFPEHLWGRAPRPAIDVEQEARDQAAARALGGAWLDPAKVDWRGRGAGEDTDQDGRPDRWSVEDAREDVRWVGLDTDGDGAVDFVHADLGRDGVFERSAYLEKDGSVEETNLVEAWLEMTFRLPWARTAYEKHDVDVVVNGVVVGKIRDAVPEGNYAFRVPPRAIRFGAAGAPADNDVELRTSHLRGGHYVVSSDFRWKVRMTATRAWVVAGDEAEARGAVLETPGLALGAHDVSVSEAEVAVTGGGPLAKGAQAQVSARLRNLGGAGVTELPVALVRTLPGQPPREVARRVVPVVPLSGEVLVSLPWRVEPGAGSLAIVADPDRALGDASPEDDEGQVLISVAGDDEKPALEIAGPRDGAVLPGTANRIEALATDDIGLASVEARIDGGLWTPLRADRRGAPGLHAAPVLLQPGARAITVRATDSSGNVVERTARVTVAAKAPEARILEPSAGARIDGRSAGVRLQVPPGAALAAVRAGGGPWTPLPIEGGFAAADVPPGFGQGSLEAMVAGKDGAASRLSQPVEGTRQPTAAEAEGGGGEGGGRAPASPRKGIVDVPGVGPVDLLDGEGGGSAIAPPAADDAPPMSGDAGGTADARREAPGAAGPAEAPAATGDGGFAGPPTPPSSPPGGYVALQKRASDWYCTNRPHIGTKFRLPDWLKRKNLPKPGTKEYDAMLKTLLDQMRARGIDTSKLERFQEALVRRCRGLKGPDDLPGFLESLGLAGPKPDDPAAEKVWRERMEEGAKAWWLRLLASGDPKLVAEGLRARGEALGQFDKALQDAAQGAIIEIQANQKITEDVLNAVPFVGDAMDILSLVRGETLSGDKMTGFDYALTMLGLGGPLVIGKCLESKSAREALESFAEGCGEMGASGKRALCETLGIPVKRLDDAAAAVTEALTKERHLWKDKLDDAAEAEAKAFAKTAAGQADRALMEADRAAAEKLVQRLDDAHKSGDEKAFQSALFDLQRDKTAQALINGKNVPDDLRRAAKGKIDGLYDAVDGEVKRDVKAAVKEALDAPPGVKSPLRDDIQALAKKHGVDPKDIEVDVMTITNTRPLKPGEVPTTSFGRDRDVTYVFSKKVVDADGTVRHVPIGDVDHAVSKGIYEANFWKQTRGAPVPDAKTCAKWADEMDQTVTSKWHPEAYNTGEVHLNDFLDKGQVPTLTRIEDVRDTVTFKSTHWFEKAERSAHAGDALGAAKESAEGMRQATKQYRDLVLSRVKQYGLDPGLHVPPRLQSAMEIFQRVNDMKISPKQADAMLAKLGRGFDKATAVKDLGGFLEGLEKTAGNRFRSLKTAELTRGLERIPGRGTEAWRTASVAAINDALKSGHVSGEAFTRLRAQVLSVDPGSSKETLRRLRAWAGEAFARRAISSSERLEIEERCGPD